MLRVGFVVRIGFLRYTGRGWSGKNRQTTNSCLGSDVLRRVLEIRVDFCDNRRSLEILYRFESLIGLYTGESRNYGIDERYYTLGCFVLPVLTTGNQFVTYLLQIVIISENAIAHPAPKLLMILKFNDRYQ